MRNKNVGRIVAFFCCLVVVGGAGSRRPLVYICTCFVFVGGANII